MQHADGTKLKLDGSLVLSSLDQQSVERLLAAVDKHAEASKEARSTAASANPSQ